MDPEFPGDTELSDSLYGGGFRIVSPGMRAFLQRVQPDHIEYLPVRIVDHQGRVASEQYSLVHPVGQVDCIDLEASGVDWSPLDPKLIDSCDQLIIDARRVPPERVIFRPKHLAGVILVRDDVARELSSSGLRGVFLQPASEYIGI
jgi:hypothetical protein